MTERRPARRVTLAERRARLASRQLLLPSSRTDAVASIADALVGLHSSDPVSVHLSTMARMVSPAITEVEAALYEDRAVVRYHAMRRTLWVSTPHVARLAHASCTTKLLTTMRRQLLALLEANGIADGGRWIDDARAQTLAALDAAGEATTRELGVAVPELRHPLVLSPGKSYGSTIAAHTRLLSYLGFEGEIIRTRPVGSWVSGQYRWAHATRWIAGGLVGEEPRASAAALVRRWLRAFGPAPSTDLQWWMGWNARDTATALADAEAVPVTVDGAEAWLDAEDLAPVTDTEPWVALLPGLDPTTMGWKQRGWYLEPDHATQVFDRNGNGGPTIWMDGRIVGSWARRDDGSIAWATFEPVPRRRQAAIDAAAESLRAQIGETHISWRFPVPIHAHLVG